MVRPSAALFSGIAGIITAVAALLAVFLNDAGDRADKADDKSDAAFDLLKQQMEYVEKDLSLIRDSQTGQASAVNEMSKQVAVLKAQLEMLARMRREAMPSVPTAAPLIRPVSAPPVQAQRPEMPESLDAMLQK